MSTKKAEPILYQAARQLTRHLYEIEGPLTLPIRGSAFQKRDAHGSTGSECQRYSVVIPNPGFGGCGETGKLGEVDVHEAENHIVGDMGHVEADLREISRKRERTSKGSTICEDANTLYLRLVSAEGKGSMSHTLA